MTAATSWVSLSMNVMPASFSKYQASVSNLAPFGRNLAWMSSSSALWL